MKIHFYPFNTTISAEVESYTNIQGIYVDSYPAFLRTVFSIIKEVQVFSYSNTFSKIIDTDDIGFSNWQIDTLTHMTSERNYPLEGFGVTGFLHFTSKECQFQLTILDLDKKEIFKEEERRFPMEELFSVVVHEAIHTIRCICQMPDQLFNQIVVHESLLKDPGSFLWHLYISGMLDKKAFFPELFTTEKILLAFKDCFTIQPDFLVMELIFQDFVSNLSDQDKRDFGYILDEIRMS